jgi:hypothetical protein
MKNAVESVIDNTQSDPESEHTNYQRDYAHQHSSSRLHFHLVFAPGPLDALQQHISLV